MLIGGFVSVSGGLHQAIKHAHTNNFEVAMFFIGSPHSWRLPQLTAAQVDQYNQQIKNSCVRKTYAHALYLANLATPDQDIYHKSIRALTTTLQNGEKIGLEGVIFHLGSHKDTSSNEGLRRVVLGIQQVLNQSPGHTKIIMENSVQQGDKVGVTLQELGWVLRNLPDQYTHRVSVCFDTCHGFAMGYDYKNPRSFQELITDLETHIGLNRLSCFHVNDSQGQLGSHIDRHANLGEGYIGLDGFRKLINEPRFDDKDFILEIPGVNQSGPRKEDRELLLSLRGN